VRTLRLTDLTHAGDSTVEALGTTLLTNEALETVDLRGFT